jgi:hypothetical protein
MLQSKARQHKYSHPAGIPILGYGICKRCIVHLISVAVRKDPVSPSIPEVSTCSLAPFVIALTKPDRWWNFRNRSLSGSQNCGHFSVTAFGAGFANRVVQAAPTAGSKAASWGSSLDG